MAAVLSWCERGEFYLSRHVPGGTVWAETRRFKDGVETGTVRIECIEYSVK